MCVLLIILLFSISLICVLLYVFVFLFVCVAVCVHLSFVGGHYVFVVLMVCCVLCCFPVDLLSVVFPMCASFCLFIVCYFRCVIILFLLCLFMCSNFRCTLSPPASGQSFTATKVNLVNLGRPKQGRSTFTKAEVLPETG